MGFWIFMFIMNLLIPLTMIGFGSYFYKKASKEINHVFGYRTRLSMKNRDTWEFAHHYCGKLWRKIGWIMLPISAIAMVFVFGKEIDTVGLYGGVLNGIQVSILLVSIFPTEIALRRRFDKKGRRKQ
ncbi:MAG TPA: hypothetical protein DGK91_06570 [Clostridium sp.]|nr:hypothetical protein [Clostridium sp.]